MIYVDLGAYNGDTVEQFINWGQLLGDISDAKIYAFEPNPDFKKEWTDIHDRHIKHVKEINFIEKAAWTDNKGLTFGKDLAPEPIGSTVMPSKRNWDGLEKIPVKTFDFSHWLRKFDGETIYIKFDIEGAEYPILRKMIEEQTDLLVTMMMIEWHGGKMGQYWLDEEQWIKENLNCEWIEWR